MTPIARRLRALLLAPAAMTLLASSALAQGGINLSWNDCGTFGTLQRNFACDTNSGSHTLVGSAITGVDLPQLNGMSAVVHLTSDQFQLPSWWAMNSGACRGEAMTASFDFQSASNCLDPWAGAGTGGLAYEQGYAAPNRAMVQIACGIPGTTAINGTDEYYFFKLTFTNAKTVGTGACAGCGASACFVMTSLTVTQPAGLGDFSLRQPIMRDYVQWQPGFFFCPPMHSETGTRPSTWGAVKSLYR